MSNLKFKRKDQLDFIKIGKKGCNTCGKILEVENFQKQNTKIGYRGSCKFCRHQNDRKKEAKTFLNECEFWHKLNSNTTERLRVKQIQNNFSISFEEALSLYHKSQNGCCSVCKKTKVENKKELSIDHCHVTGKIRGILCSNCNSGIGLLKDSIDILELAIEYLKQNT